LFNSKLNGQKLEFNTPLSEHLCQFDLSLTIYFMSKCFIPNWLEWLRIGFSFSLCLLW